MDEAGQIQWRRDAATSSRIRWLRSLGLGTFVAAIGLIVYARLFALSGLSSDGPLAIGGLALLVLGGYGIVLLDQRLDVLGVGTAGPIVSTVAMGALIVVLARGLGGGVGHGLAALTIPLGFIALGLASFLRSVGTLDRQAHVLYLHEPDTRVDLEHVSAVRVRPISQSAFVRLSYEEPDGQYVPGPRRLVLPPAVARELQSIVADDQSESSSSRVS